MTLTVRKNTRNQDIDKMFYNFREQKLFDADALVGKVAWGEDALVYQRKIRNEWN